MKYLISFILVTTILISCKKKHTDDTPNFDTGAMLANYSDNLIVPGYINLVVQLDSLNNKTIDFANNPTTSSLTDLKAQWKSAYLFWQTMKVYHFGPAMDNHLRQILSLYPVDTTKINTNVTNNETDLSITTSPKAIGFNAMDYLLFHTDDNTIITEFTTDNKATNRQNYLKNLSLEMLTVAQTVKSAWSSYASTFKTATGSDANSSLSLLVNAYNQDYELLKNAKVGIPLGEQSVGIQRPEYIEARYSEISFDLAKASTDALKNVFTGASGSGFDDYLDKLEKKVDNQLLSTTISGQFDAISTKIASYTGTMEYEIANNTDDVKTLYVLLQGIVAEIKTDMPSAFGVFITYNDTDGD